MDSTNLPRDEFFTTEMTVRDSPCTKNRDRIAGVTASSCRFTWKKKRTVRGRRAREGERERCIGLTSGDGEIDIHTKQDRKIVRKKESKKERK